MQGHLKHLEERLKSKAKFHSQFIKLNLNVNKALLKTDREPNQEFSLGEEEGWPQGGDLIHGLIR